MYVTGSTVEVEDSNFTSCSAQADAGGAMFIDSSMATISRASFTSCGTSQYGGAMFITLSTATISGASFTSCSAVSETERPATTHYALRQLVRPSARIRTTSSFTTIDGDCCTCTQPSKLQFDPLTKIARLPPINNHFIPGHKL